MNKSDDHLKSSAFPKTGNAFLDSVGSDAVVSQRVTGVPASVTLAQAILESGWGKSSLARNYHNYFGIKGEGPKGTAKMLTGEHFGGKDVVIKAGFRVYATAAESFEDHGRFFTDNQRYAEAMRHTDDAERFAREIHKAGYATDPNYSDKLIKLIRQYELEKFDQMARSGTTVGAARPDVPTDASGSTRLGSSAAVQKLQMLLVQHGYMTGQEMQTGPGIFGPRTRAALGRLQASQGDHGPDTVVKDLQMVLVQHGYMTKQEMQTTGPGIFGPKTCAALAHLQADQQHGAAQSGNTATFQAKGVYSQSLSSIFAPVASIWEKWSTAGTKTPVTDPSFFPKQVLEFKGEGWTRSTFGDFKYFPNPGSTYKQGITIIGDWEKENIVRVDVPQLNGIPTYGGKLGGKVRFHKLAARQLQSFFAAVEAARLMELVKFWDGSFFPRYQSSSKTKLSNHSWGTAFDINAKWNGYNKKAARIGQPGCLLPLVPIAEEHGFAWGGFFKTPDGMHFEIAELR